MLASSEKKQVGWLYHQSLGKQQEELPLSVRLQSWLASNQKQAGWLASDSQKAAHLHLQSLGKQQAKLLLFCSKKATKKAESLQKGPSSL